MTPIVIIWSCDAGLLTGMTNMSNLTFM